MGKLTHADDEGRAVMVDVADKQVTRRVATATGRVTMRKETAAAIAAQRTPKGDPLETARLAGIMAAKRTADLIPLCHPLTLEHVEVEIELVEDGVEIMSSITVTAKTGAEMEALTAVAVAGLTVYDMCKALDREMEVGPARLRSKSGGRSGDYRREQP